MAHSAKFALCLWLLGGAAGAQEVQDPYGDEAEDEQDAQQYAQPPAGYPPADPNAYQQPPQGMAQQPPQEMAQQPSQYGYGGAHPIPYQYGQGFCYQAGPHYHEYPPFDQHLFQYSNGYWYFIGDVADFGYTQQMWGFAGNHPIPAAYGGGYCFINWPHRHPYPPPSTVYYNLVGGYYSYIGPWDPWYYSHRAYWWGYYGGY